MKRKKIVGIVVGGVCCLCLCMGLVIATTNKAKADSSQVPSTVENELFPEKEIPDEYEKDNLYVQMNNKLVKAMNDYEAGTISEQGYNAICAEISKVVNDKDNQETMKKQESEINKELGTE